MTPEATFLPSPAAYTEAVATAARAALAYYGDGATTLDDDEYDAPVRGIADYEASHPQAVLPGSPTGKVAGGVVSGDVPHSIPMLSLDNVFSPEELASWAAGLERRLGRPVSAGWTVEWTVEPKLDGLAVAARYQEGRLVQLITRDGPAGVDITHAASDVLGLPARLNEPVDLELRGEVLLTDDQFEHQGQLEADLHPPAGEQRAPPAQVGREAAPGRVVGGAGGAESRW